MRSIDQTLSAGRAILPVRHVKNSQIVGGASRLADA
jgi:hypothetical protein